MNYKFRKGDRFIETCWISKKNQNEDACKNCKKWREIEFKRIVPSELVEWAASPGAPILYISFSVLQNNFCCTSSVYVTEYLNIFELKIKDGDVIPI